MQRLRALRLIIAITALIFVAKPFLGFGTGKQFKQGFSHTILVKSFTKRKPETLEDADNKVEAIHQKLSNPLLLLLPAIAFLLAILLPSLLETCVRLTGRIITDIRTALLPPDQAYLLAGKLSI